MERYKGAAFTALSAVIFGFTPILARLAYDGGSNGVTVTFLRAALALPVLWLILRVRGVSVRATGEELKYSALVGIIGSAGTTLTLYASYSYIPVGMASTLHFVYPMLTTLCCILFFKERISLSKALALVLAMAGVVCFMGKADSGAALGVTLSVISGFTYAFYIIGLDKTGLREMYYFKLSFYLCLFTALTSGVFGLATGSLALTKMNGMAWFYSFLVSMFVSIAALALFQLGVRLIGASTAGILSTLEPITSVVLGILILHEELSWAKLLGCLLIVGGIVMITFAERGRPAAGGEGK